MRSGLELSQNHTALKALIALKTLKADNSKGSGSCDIPEGSDSSEALTALPSCSEGVRSAASCCSGARPLLLVLGAASPSSPSPTLNRLSVQMFQARLSLRTVSFLASSRPLISGPPACVEMLTASVGVEMQPNSFCMTTLSWTRVFCR